MTEVTIGIDIGDVNHQICVLTHDGVILEEVSIRNTAVQLDNYFSQFNSSTIVIEASTHSHWISLHLESMGHVVYVANPRKVKAIWASSNKSDVRDVQMLARIGRFDKDLLYPIKHRDQKAQLHLQSIKARDVLVATCTQLVNHVRSTIKVHEERIRKCQA